MKDPPGIDGDYLSKAFRLRVLLKAEGREMDTGSEHLGLGQYTDTSDTVEFHLHVRVAVWVSEVSKMRPPGGVLCVALHDYSIFIQSVRKGQGSFGFLPGVEVVGLLST
jgi:hypothetical protein